MEFELLGNICEVVRGSSPRPQGDKRYYGGNIPRLMIADVTRDKKYVTPIIDSLTEEGASKSRPMKKGDLIIAVSGDPGRVCFLNVDACIHDGFVGLRNLDESKYDKDFLYYYLTFFKYSMKHRAYGAIFQNITTDILKGIKIPKLSISAQNNIAKLASKAENLIAQRKESIRLLDEFLKSTFLEMFGDPVRNEKGWEINSFSKFGSLKNGLNYTRRESGVNVRCLGVGDFKELSKLTDMESLQVLNLTSEPNNEYFLKDGDLVFVRSNGNRELVGRCLLVFPNSAKVTFSGFCIRYRIEKKGLNPIFISHLFRVPIFRTSMLQGGKGANIQNISQQTLEKLKIPIPPIQLQTQFAQIVEKTEALKTQYQQSLQELESLYGSLSQKAFRGELILQKNHVNGSDS